MRTAHQIRLKRAYDPPEASDGTRILINRLWPRGIKKTDAEIDRWLKTLRRAQSCGGGSDTGRSAGPNSAGDIAPSCGGIWT